MAKIFVFGAGGFGVSLAVMCDKNGHSVTLYSPFEQEVETLARDRQHKKLLPGVILPESIEITCVLPDPLDHALVIIAVPSFAVRTAAASLKPVIGKETVVSCVSKGFEPDTYKLLSDVIAEELPDNAAVMISGPSHAEEVSRGVPTTVTAASQNREAAEFVQDTLMNSTFRIYTHDDVIGVELGGALKNVIALAAGIISGLKLGDNPKAALMTRGLTEIARLGTALGAKAETFAGLSGVGDLIVTCTSEHSRNNRAGRYIGEGLTAAQAIEKVGMTVEGYTATKCAYALAQEHNVEMPICRQIYAILYEGKSVSDATNSLMSRPKKHETEASWLQGD